jgi:hypothetical protein
MELARFRILQALDQPARKHFANMPETEKKRKTTQAAKHSLHQ